MKISIRFLLKGTIWTVGAFGLGLLVRFATNVFLARLLAPELFGIMLIVNSLTMGIELLTDVGIGQNIVYHKDANDPDFYNTAWTLQAIRSLLLWLVALAIALPVAQFYRTPILGFIVPLTAFTMVLGGFTSVSRSLLQKRMEVAKLNLFDATISVVSSAAYVLLAYLDPTIWALVFGGLFGSATTMVASYFLLSDVKQRFHISKLYFWEILHFGKWIFFSSIVFFLSTNFDRLYLAKVVPLELLGIYGIARTISEMLGLVVMRVGNYVLFPLIVSNSQILRADLRKQLASIRAKFLLAAALGFSLLAATPDLLIKLIYDERYHAAGWMLPILILGSWFSILAYLNESTLLGLGKPSYTAFANGAKFLFLLIGLPISVKSYGLLGGVIVVALADTCRYLPILVGQKRENLSFGRQDLFITLTVLALVALWEWLRWVWGVGTSFESLPIDMEHIFRP